MIAYPAMLDVPTELVTFVADLLAAERDRRGTRPGTRALSCEKQAIFVLVWFRECRPVALTGKGLGISQATSYRYLDEALDVLDAQAPDLHEALQRGHDECWSHVILDGKVVDTDRLHVKTTCKKGKTIDAWYSGKTRDFGGNIQALMRHGGFPIWISEVEPGSVHDLTAAREHVLGALYAAAGKGLPTLADPGYEGAGHGVHTPVKQPTDGSELDINTRTRNTLLRHCAPWANADSPCSPNGGAPYNTSPSAPARSARSRGQPSSSLTSNTATWLAEKTSLGG